VGMVLFPVLYNVIVIRPRIYYIIDYSVNLSSREEIIHKVEDLNYTAYLHNFYSYYEYFGINSYVDSDLIYLLKSRIENDIGFKLWPFYEHYLRYSFLAENHSRLYLTYDNNTIFSIKDQNNQSLFLLADCGCIGLAWYLNFTQIPYVYGDKSTVMFSDFIFVEINLEYKWLCGYICEHSHSFKQYLVLGENLEVVLIFVDYYIFID